MSMNLNFLFENIFYLNSTQNTYYQIETILINFSFLSLFFSTLYYWITFSFFPKNSFPNFGVYGLTFANLSLFFQLILRWGESGHFPLSNLYDSLLFLSWGLIALFLLLETNTQLDLLGILISPLVLCILAFTDFVLPEDLQKVQALVPALQSNWLLMHVSVMILSYAALILGSVLSISYICYFYYLTQFLYSPSTSDFNEKDLIQETRLNPLDNISYRLIGIGFCFLTLGILSGAIWANETWGNYWSWDPKETWALITWLIFAIYLHTRLIHGVQGVKAAWIAFFGFLILWICYLGVNLLGKGLHSYGFFTS